MMGWQELCFEMDYLLDCGVLFGKVDDEPPPGASTYECTTMSAYLFVLSNVVVFVI